MALERDFYPTQFVRMFFASLSDSHASSQYLLECIPVQLLGDVILAVGVFERQIELVVFVEEFIAASCVRSCAFQIPTTTEYVNLYVLLQFIDVLHSTVCCVAVRHEPRRHLCFSDSVVSRRFFGKFCYVRKLDKSFVRGDDCRVGPICGRPVDVLVWRREHLSIWRRFQHEFHPNLIGSVEDSHRRLHRSREHDNVGRRHPTGSMSEFTVWDGAIVLLKSAGGV